MVTKTLLKLKCLVKGSVLLRGSQLCNDYPYKKEEDCWTSKCNNDFDEKMDCTIAYLIRISYI